MPPRHVAALIPALVLAAAAAAPTTARADGQAALKDRARREVADGLAAQDAGDFDAAIAHYQRAYRLVPHPEILFNLGQAHRLDGDPARALGYYRRYLAIDPHGRVARDASRWIAELEPIVGDAPDPVDDGLIQPERPPAARSRRARTLRLAGLATAGAGALSLGIAVKLGLDARGISDELGDHDGAWTDALLARQDEGRRAETRMYVAVGVGAAAVIGGAVLYTLGSRTGDRATPAVSLAPWLGGDHAGLAVAGRWW